MAGTDMSSAPLTDPISAQGGKGKKRGAKGTGSSRVPDEESLPQMVNAGGATAPEPAAPATPTSTGAASGRDPARTVMHEAQAALTTEAFKPETKVPASGGGYKLLGDVSKQDQEIIARLQDLVQARSMTEHFSSFANLSYDVHWDAPPVYLRGRDSMRCMVYWAKTVATMAFDVVGVKSEAVGDERVRLTMEVDFHVLPLKPWWLGPALLVIPEDIPIRATLVVGVLRGASEPAGSPGTVAFIWGRWHNLPTLPTVVRAGVGAAMGHGLRAIEPLWSKVLAPLGIDRSYVDNRAVTGPSTSRAY